VNESNIDVCYICLHKTLDTVFHPDQKYVLIMSVFLNEKLNFLHSFSAF